MILVTGGAGYIGSHTCIELLNAGFDLVVLDNLANASLNNLKQVEQITGHPIHFVNGDIGNKTDLTSLFEQYDVNAVIHFAGLKSPIESLHSPAEYFHVNVAGSLNLLQVMTEHRCKNLIFSSSASIYANSSQAVSEHSALNPLTPYSRSKRMVELILSDLFQADPEWSISILRYFNPVGAHHSGLIGENPKAAATNLMPCLLEVASGKRESLKIFGNDYPTPDGTGIRDYIHVMDLASAHVAALQALPSNKVDILNIGRGMGHSVLELIQTFESVTGQNITYEIAAKRPNDLAFSLADPSLAHQVLAWQAQYNLSEMCADSWRWQQQASALF